jgi:hypothetical protein
MDTKLASFALDDLAGGSILQTRQTTDLRDMLSRWGCRLRRCRSLDIFHRQERLAYCPIRHQPLLSSRWHSSLACPLACQQICPCPSATTPLAQDERSSRHTSSMSFRTSRTRYWSASSSVPCTRPWIHVSDMLRTYYWP